MGNIVITVSWKPCFNDYIIQYQLKNLANNRGLNTDTNPIYSYYKPGYTQFIADISGLLLAFNRQSQYNKVYNFGEESKRLLDNLGVKNYDIHIDDLPL
jgi:hypothetical protein